MLQPFTSIRTPIEHLFCKFRYASGKQYHIILFVH
jgi:hypothetical protein